MTFDYKKVFEQAQKSLIEYGMQRRTLEQINAYLGTYKSVTRQELTDDDYFAELVKVVFYSGFRAATVNARIDIIHRWLPDCPTVAGYGEDQVTAAMADDKMIRNERKIRACIKNAKTMIELARVHGSFAKYLGSLEPLDTLENLLLLKEELEARFEYLGGITGYHFLSELGMPVLKPDRVICRIFHRLGLLEKEDQYLKAVIQGRKFAQATGLPIRYIDIIFVTYGQVQTVDVGLDRGICLNKPRCSVCGLKGFCRAYTRGEVSAN